MIEHHSVVPSYISSRGDESDIDGTEGWLGGDVDVEGSIVGNFYLFLHDNDQDVNRGDLRRIQDSAGRNTVRPEILATPIQRLEGMDRSVQSLGNGQDCPKFREWTGLSIV